MIRQITAAASILLFAGCSPQQAGETSPAAAAVRSQAVHPVSGLAVVPLTISDGSKNHRFQVEVAATQEDQAKGLMFRTAMKPDEGMIFPRDEVGQASFWMKNTPLSLDIIFIGPDGTISNIAANTVPYSLDPVNSTGLASAVLELNAGRAAELGIKAGDRVQYSTGKRCFPAPAERASSRLALRAESANRAPMSIFGKIFTWWNGATIGTLLNTWRTGEQVGTDAQGNRYYRARNTPKGATERRWVLYEGANDASRVPPEWHGWLHGQFVDLPESFLPPAKIWETEYTPNATGTTAAYRPQGALERGGRRAATSGDYESWTPDN